MARQKTIKDFMNEEFKSFADYDNRRMIPSVVDGLKISNRKVLYTLYKHPGKHKVSVLGSTAAAFTCYAHGEDSIIDTVIGMAQTFPGANNMPLLEALGQFGTRLNHESSAPRYIYTKLHPNFQRVFSQEDMAILPAQTEEGQEIEPEFFLPVLPLIAINGSRGVGNGFMCNILNHSAASVKKAVTECAKTGKVSSKVAVQLNGWTGKIESVGRSVKFTGKLELAGANRIVISELPPSMQLYKYKAVLNQLIDEKLINDYENNSNENAWSFEIKCPRSTTALPMETLLAKFKLIERATQTITVWGYDRIIKQFDSIEALIEYWVEGRLGFYEKRRLNNIKQLREEAEWLSTKLRFIIWWNGTPGVQKLNKAELQQAAIVGVKTTEEAVSRLFRIPVSSLTLEEKEALEREIAAREFKLAFFESTTAKDLMLEDLSNT